MLQGGKAEYIPPPVKIPARREREQMLAQILFDFLVCIVQSKPLASDLTNAFLD